MTRMRLQKFLARAGVASRRRCDAEVIPAGRVCVNGKVVTDVGTSVDPESDEVLVDGEPVHLPIENVTLMLNKPAGFATAMSDGRNARLVSELVPVDDHPGLFHVGRLDRDTTGLLLFTNDGNLGNGLLHPSRNVAKRYIAEVEGRLSHEDVRRLEQGVQLDDGMTAPAQLEVLDRAYAITIHEGRKRQVRRMFEAVGHPALKLHRETFGPLGLDGLAEGEWRILEESEVSKLQKACGC